METHAMTTLPFLKPEMFVPAETELLNDIASLGPEWRWVLLLPKTHLDTALLQVLCDKVNAFTGAQP
jgi:hypothetical protein